ncbi:MAG: S-methyl-5'-thioadenosine phosphorylase [Dehalococcoidia bacterium]
MTTTSQARVGIIGGTGLYEIEGLTNVRETVVSTPYGDPSDAFTIGEMDGVSVAFLPRHGRGHRLLPTEIPVHANIHAMKQLGVESLISVSAVGSLREDIAPLDMVVPDQLIDRTRQRQNTFFGSGLVAHVSFGDPFCPELREQLVRAVSGANVHRNGTYVVMEGPAFSTRAESEMYRSWGASIVGMTALPEAKLAREAEMCYAVLATATDYDVWHQTEAHVSVDLVLANLQRNAEVSRGALRNLIPTLSGERACSCSSALSAALVTPAALVPTETLERLGPIVGKYMPQAVAARSNGHP